MGWRWRNSINLGGGARATLSDRGMGVSWGLAGVRIGKSPTGSLWVSFSVPGTGISFFRYLSNKSPQIPQPLPRQPSVSAPQPSLESAPTTPLTANERVLKEIYKKKP